MKVELKEVKKPVPSFVPMELKILIETAEEYTVIAALLNSNFSDTQRSIEGIAHKKHITSVPHSKLVKIQRFLYETLTGQCNVI